MADAVGVLDVVEGQDSCAGIVAPLVVEVEGNAAAASAAPLDHFIGEPTGLLQRDGAPLREEANPSGVVVAVEHESGSNTLSFCPSNEYHGLMDAHADDMFATVVDDRLVHLREPEHISKRLYN